MSFFDPLPNGLGPVIRRAANQVETDDAGFARTLAKSEIYQQPKWWQTELLPEPLRHSSGHDGSHTFLTHEFIDALVPGIVAHQSALNGGLQMKIPLFPK
jgi:hypothetical protein